MATSISIISITTTLNPNSFLNLAFCSTIPRSQCITLLTVQEGSVNRSKISCVHELRGRRHTDILKPVCALGSGLETSMMEAKGGILTFKSIEYSVESEDSEKIKLRVDLTGEETQKAFDVVLLNLARSAPPIPGFRRQKGGKTAKVPKNLLLDIIGKERVTNFVIREIVTSAAADYIEKESLTVKDDKISTTQIEEELKQSFLPGNAFGFTVELELVNGETDETSTETGTETETET